MTFIDPDSIQQEQASQAATQPSHEDFVDPDTLVSTEAKRPSTALPRGQKRKISRTEALYTGFKRAPDELAEGLLQIGGKAASAAGFDTSGFENRLANLRNQRNAEYAEAARQNPVTTRVGYVGGNMSQVGAPVGGAKTVLGKMGVGALGGALTAAAQYHEKAQSRLTSGIIGGVLGGVIPVAATRLTAGAGKLVHGIGRRVINPRKAAKLDAARVLAPGRTKANSYIETAGAQQGLQVGPLDTTTSDVAKTKFKSVIGSERAQLKVEAALRDRTNKARQKLQKMAGDIVPEGHEIAATKVHAQYQEALPKPIPSKVHQHLMQDPKIAEQAADAVRSKDSPVKYMKPGTLEYWDAVKRNLDAKIQVADKPNTKMYLNEVRNKLVEQLDESTPAYAPIRRKAELVEIQRSLQERIKNVPLPGGKQQPDIHDLKKNLFDSIGQRNRLVDSIKQAGGDAKQAKRLLRVLHVLSDDKTLKAMTRKNTTPAAMKHFGDVSSRILDSFGDVVNGKYNDALVEIAIDPKFGKQVMKMAKLANKRVLRRKLAGALLDTLGVGAGTATTRGAENPTRD